MYRNLKGNGNRKQKIPVTCITGAFYHNEAFIKFLTPFQNNYLDIFPDIITRFLRSTKFGKAEGSRTSTNKSYFDQ